MAGELACRTIVMPVAAAGSVSRSRWPPAARAPRVLLAKTDTPDPRLPGTVHTAVEEIEGAVAGCRGGEPLERPYSRPSAPDPGGRRIRRMRLNGRACPADRSKHGGRDEPAHISEPG